MEDIYTIKVRTNPDPRTLYPSERRYSASTVLGLGVVHLALAATTILLASLSLNSHNLKTTTETFDILTSTALIQNKTIVSLNLTEEIGLEDRDADMAFLDEDEAAGDETSVLKSDAGNHFASLTLAPCIMSLGALTAGITGLLAWKRWYVDHNIRWFFFMSALSTIASLACLTMTGISIGMVTEQRSELSTQNTFIFSFADKNVIIDKLSRQNDVDPNQNIQSKVFGRSSGNPPNLRLVLAVNIFIAAFLEFAWSVLSAKIAFYGMKNNYPDDIVLSGGKVEVNTVHKGSKKKKTVAPDILNHHPKKRKFLKYFSKMENEFLPKQESNTEYQARVNKFLSSNSNDTTGMI